MIVIFSEDLNSLDYDGRKFTAVPGPEGRCTGCEFKQGFGCKLAEDGAFRTRSPNCKPDFGRTDGAHIVWQPSVRQRN